MPTDPKPMDEARDVLGQLVTEAQTDGMPLTAEKLSGLLALLDAMAARLEVAGEMAEVSKKMRMYALGNDCTTKNIIGQFDAAFARWEAGK